MYAFSMVGGEIGWWQGWLVAVLVGGKVGWWQDWLVARWVGGKIGWWRDGLVARLVGGKVGWWQVWLVTRLVGGKIGWWQDWLVARREEEKEEEEVSWDALIILGVSLPPPSRANMSSGSPVPPRVGLTCPRGLRPPPSRALPTTTTTFWA